MRRTALPAALLAAGAFLGCGDRAPTPPDAPFASAELLASRASPTHAGTHLSGGEEVPPNDSRAQGQLNLRLSADGETLTFKLIAANVQNITQAHLHRAPAGTNGGIVVWLYPAGPPAQLIPGRHSGVLAEGEITAGSLVGSLAGQPLAALLDEIRAGNIYANVHTSQFPPGEIRGQLGTR